MVLVAATHRGLVRIAFGDFLDPGAVVEELSERISPRVLEVPSYFDGVRRELDEYFQGRRTSFDLPLDWQLTRGFNRQVLRRTAQIPYGEVSTYQRVAEAAGSPRAYRAAGNALGSNPIPIVVPCHRVLATGGGLGGYGGGLGPQGVPFEARGSALAQSGGSALDVSFAAQVWYVRVPRSFLPLVVVATMRTSYVPLPRPRRSTCAV